jgi:hypothetical protein
MDVEKETLYGGLKPILLQIFMQKVRIYLKIPNGE